MKKILAGIALAVALGGMASYAPAAHASHTTSDWLQPGQEKWVDGGNYVVRNDDFGAKTGLNNTGNPGFSIYYANNVTNWSAYPYVGRGWSWGVGTYGGWPVKVSADGAPRSTLVTHQTWRGTYNTAYDMWFSTYPNKTTQANGAEVMVWLSHPGINPNTYRQVYIDGAWWGVMSWRAHSSHGSWNYIAYIRDVQTSSVYGMWLNPFFRDAEAHGSLRSYWYWTSVEAGFELCRGGAGLAIDYFRVSV
jgi:hypothetical protein